MQSATFRKWLAEHGCRFDIHEHKRGEGQVLVTVHREGRKSEVSLGGSSRIKPASTLWCRRLSYGLTRRKIGLGRVITGQFVGRVNARARPH